MLNPNEEHALMEERKRDLLRSARMSQLYQQADDDRAQAGERFMTLIGDLMISGGQKLKARSNSSNARYRTDAPSL
jgi:hypothetical protein